MAYFGESNLSCPCGNDVFKENKIVTIKPEFKNTNKGIVGDIAIPGRFLNSEKVSYTCTKCGKELTI